MKFFQRLIQLRLILQSSSIGIFNDLCYKKNLNSNFQIQKQICNDININVLGCYIEKYVIYQNAPYTIHHTPNTWSC